MPVSNGKYVTKASGEVPRRMLKRGEKVTWLFGLSSFGVWASVSLVLLAVWPALALVVVLFCGRVLSSGPVVLGSVLQARLLLCFSFFQEGATTQAKAGIPPVSLLSCPSKRLTILLRRQMRNNRDLRWRSTDDSGEFGSTRMAEVSLQCWNT